MKQRVNPFTACDAYGQDPFARDDLIDHITKFHPATSLEVGKAHNQVRRIINHAMKSLADVVPASSERTNALRVIQEAMMWCNAAIALHQPVEED